MEFLLEFEQETDGRRIVEISELPSMMAYGMARMQMGKKAKSFALQVPMEHIYSNSPWEIHGALGLNEAKVRSARLCRKYSELLTGSERNGSADEASPKAGDETRNADANYGIKL